MEGNLAIKTKIKAYVNRVYAEEERIPSIREIAEHIGISKSGVQRYMSDMDGEFIYEKATGNILVPVVGDIACGMPILAEENISEYIKLPVSVATKGAKYYILKAKGESMIGANINDGDYVLIRQCDTAESGQIVVALVGDEGTLKRYYPQNNGVILHPENPAMEDIFVESIKIQGVAVKSIKIADLE